MNRMPSADCVRKLRAAPAQFGAVSLTAVLLVGCSPAPNASQSSAAAEATAAQTMDPAVGAADPKPTEWSDTVMLREQSGRFVVADIAFGGQWDFANKGTMLEALRASLE